MKFVAKDLSKRMTWLLKQFIRKSFLYCFTCFGNKSDLSTKIRLGYLSNKLNNYTSNCRDRLVKMYNRNLEPKFHEIIVHVFMGQNGWDSILMFSLISSKFLAMRNITLCSVRSHARMFLKSLKLRVCTNSPLLRGLRVGF